MAAVVHSGTVEVILWIELWCGMNGYVRYWIELPMKHATGVP